MKPEKGEHLDEAIFLWFAQTHEKGIPISMLQVKS